MDDNKQHLSIKDENVFNSKTERLKSDYFSTEKTVETEFYNLADKYYSNKYTLKSEGYVSYTSKHNIDGLLTVRTLDIDYSILVEAKLSKNFNSTNERNSVLLQALYYAKRLESIGELIPSVLVLVEQESCVVYDSSVLEKFFMPISIGQSPASSAYIHDAQTLKKLNESEIPHRLFEFTNGMNEIFDYIEIVAKESQYSIFKGSETKRAQIDTYEFVNDFIILKENDYFYSDSTDSFYRYDDFSSRWRPVSIGSFTEVIKRYAYTKKINFSYVNFDEIVIGLKIGLSCNVVNNFTFINGGVVLNSSIELLEDSKKVKSTNYFPINFISDTIIKNNDYTLVNLFKILFGKVEVGSNVIIECGNDENSLSLFTFLKKLGIECELNPHSYTMNNTHGNILIINNLDSFHPVDTTTLLKLHNTFIFIDNFISLDALISETILAHMRKNDCEDSIENDIPETVEERVREWQENNDLILKWANKYLEPRQDSVILLQDAFESFNHIANLNGQSSFSLRYFTPSFSNHSFAFDNNINYISHKRILKKYTLSQWFDPNDKNKPPRSGNGTQSYFTNVAFKEESKDLE